MEVGIAILTMIAATVAVHLGLPQAISRIVSQVSRCHKCVSFWSTLIVLLVSGAGLFVAVLLSITAAYASNWFAAVLIVINKFYDRLWERLK